MHAKMCRYVDLPLSLALVLPFLLHLQFDLAPFTRLSLREQRETQTLEGTVCDVIDIWSPVIFCPPWQNH